MAVEFEMRGKNDVLVMKGNSELSFSPATYKTAVDAYTGFCADLGLEFSTSLVSLNGDDSSIVMDGIQILPKSALTFVNKLNYSTEGGLGFFDKVPTSIGNTSVTIPSVSRMYANTQLPVLFFTFHPPGYDCKSASTKYNKNENGACIFAKISRYNSDTVGAISVAIKITPKEIFFFFEKVDTSLGLVPLFLNTFEGNGSTSTTVYQQFPLGSLFYMSNLTSVKINLSREVYPSGDALLKNINLSEATEINYSSLTWDANIPASTTLSVTYGISEQFGAEPGAYTPIQSGESPLQNGQSYRSKYLWLKIHMETTDVETSPSITNMILSFTNANDLNKIALVLEPTERLKSPEEPIDVVYDNTIGTLSGEGQILVEPFKITFNPNDLLKVRNPGIQEHITVASCNVSATFTEVFYQERATSEYISVTNAEVSAILTHINDIGG